MQIAQQRGHNTKHYIFLRNMSLGDSAWGGLENELTNCLDAIDYGITNVTLVTTQDIFSEKFRERRLPVQVLRFPFILNGTFRTNFKNMLHFLRTLKPHSIVYVQGAFTDFKLPHFLAGFIASRGNIFSIEALGAPLPPERTKRKLHLGVIPGFGLWWYKQIFPITARGWLCKRIVTAGKEVKVRMEHWCYPKKRIFTVYLGVNRNKFSPDILTRKMMRGKFNIPEGDTVIISTARLAKIKKVDRLINSFDILSRDFKNTWLFLVGDGPLKCELQELANKKSSKERIRFLGFQEDVADYLKMSDIFVLPSDSEGLSTAMIEAMAVGLICVITKATGAQEIIRDGINGFLTEISEEGVLAGLKRALSLIRAQRESISYNAIKCITDNFDREKGIKNKLKFLSLETKAKND